MFMMPHIDANKALEWGLVDEVLPHEKLMERAWEIARQIMANGFPPPEAVTLNVAPMRNEANATLMMIRTCFLMWISPPVTKTSSDNSFYPSRCIH
jgi:enoyl-CoA hydratase/carnithine racemase